MARVLTYMSATMLLFGSTVAQADDAIAEWARWALTPKVWKGEIVPAPVPAARPSGLGLSLRSLELPLAVHSTPTERPHAVEALRALERAHLDFSQAGWPLPPAGFDLYLVPGAAAASDAGADGLLALSDFDAAQTHALVRAELAGAALEACVHSAYAQAALRALDPAESDSWLRASAEWGAFVHTGQPGCEDSLLEGQRAPEHSLLASDTAAAGSGALFLAMLGERHGDDEFLRALWELTRQHSKGLVPDDQLRGSPDLWEVLAQVLQAGGERWSEAFEEFSASRYFAGDAAAPYRALRALPSDAGVPLLADLSAGQLPLRVRTAADGGIEALGSSYVRLQLAAAPACAAGSCELRVWLRGELGPNWSLCALRLDAQGRELGRTRAPAREVPEAYLPLVLGPDTAQVVLVVTHLTRAVPEADRPILAPHGVELAIDLVGGG